VTADLTDRLRLTMWWLTREGDASFDVLGRWVDALSNPAGPPIGACVWAVNASASDTSHPRAAEFCWHRHDMPRHVDRYTRVVHRGMPWSPWGTISGPNFQFFDRLATSPSLHPEPWALSVEPDTFPLHDDLRQDVTHLLDRHPQAWVIGATPHTWVREHLPPYLLNHLNGAALYHVGSKEFVSFGAEVWTPSLMALVRQSPTTGWDAISDPALQSRLPEQLRRAWAQEAHRFVSTAGMVNVSGMPMTPDRIGEILADPALVEALAEEGVRPWQLHTRADPAERRR
jgi:hypothetical protein